MPDVEPGAAEPVDDATATAVEDIRAALSGADAIDAVTTEAARSDPPTAAASGAAVGHGTIRLRSQLPRLNEATATTAPGPDPAAVAGPVGHGTIRLRSGAPAPAAETAAVAPDRTAVAVAGPAGHGTIRLRTPDVAPPEPEPQPGREPEPAGHGSVVLYGRPAAASPRFAAPVEIDDEPTVAAREEILAALSATV